MRQIMSAYMWNREFRISLMMAPKYKPSEKKGLVTLTCRQDCDSLIKVGWQKICRLHYLPVLALYCNELRQEQGDFYVVTYKIINKRNRHNSPQNELNLLIANESLSVKIRVICGEYEFRHLYKSIHLYGPEVLPE